jgi:hypothetical protein
MKDPEKKPPAKNKMQVIRSKIDIHGKDFSQPEANRQRESEAKSPPLKKLVSMVSYPHFGQGQYRPTGTEAQEGAAYYEK